MNQQSKLWRVLILLSFPLKLKYTTNLSSRRFDLSTRTSLFSHTSQPSVGMIFIGTILFIKNCINRSNLNGGLPMKTERKFLYGLERVPSTLIPIGQRFFRN